MDDQEKYDFAYVDTHYDIAFMCTDPQLIDWFSSEVARRVPKCKTKCWKDLSGERYFVHVEKLGDEGNREAAWWLIKQLCRQGWEPFSEQWTKPWWPPVLALRKRR